LRRLVERAGLAALAVPAEAEARLRGANTPEERAGLLNR
jgi:molybdopterin-guanine dinucleotide biosynthesis protein A